MRLLFINLILFLPVLASDYATEQVGSKPYPYPLATCLTCGDGLADSTVSLTHGDRILKFCCIECVAPYTKSTQTYISSLEEQIRGSQRDSYPLKTCLISGHELGSMGEPIEYVSGNTLVKFCCAACIEKFEQDRVQMLYKLKTASSDKQGGPKPKKE